MAGAASWTRELDRDPTSGRRRWFHWNDEDKTFTIETEQDVTDLVELNKEVAKEDTGRFGEFTRVASVPMNVYFDLKQKGVIDDAKKLKAWLNDPDNRYYRTKLGRV
jgi:hypothetical protein